MLVILGLYQGYVKVILGLRASGLQDLAFRVLGFRVELRAWDLSLGLKVRDLSGFCVEGSQSQSLPSHLFPALPAAWGAL